MASTSAVAIGVLHMVTAQISQQRDVPAGEWEGRSGMRSTRQGNDWYRRRDHAGGVSGKLYLDR